MLVKEGSLGKFGKILENTPDSWKKFYEDYKYDSDCISVGQKETLCNSL